MIEPHVRRYSLWDYARLAVSTVTWFGDESETGDQATPPLIPVRDVPALVLFAIQDIKTKEKALETLALDGTDKGLQTIGSKVRFLILGGVLPVYDPEVFLRIDLSQIPEDLNQCLVRLDELSDWLHTEGIAIGHSLTSEAEADQSIKIQQAALEALKDAVEKDIDPADLPDELHAANTAFRAVQNGYGDQSATYRNRLIDFLKNHNDYLKPEAIYRIATVANPDKARGRKTRETK